jgi:hydrogenase maturation protein HypF
MALEFLAGENPNQPGYEYTLQPVGDSVQVDWRPMLRGIIDDIAAKTQPAVIAARFHATLAEMIAGVARRMGEPKVILSGGCFQNRCLTEKTVIRLREEGFRPYWHQRIPPNDGGIALGQIVAAQREA